ncbi:hypothetical protein [Edaphobacter bradus]|uniref:hypothetical protein n=1 Tax=Edaphobacter bradus TaxID=2259016 RepID=UPI0021E00F0C|nr:hypothetical protein [Edaphobacter bradus]
MANLHALSGKAGQPAFPSFPQFEQIPIPGNLTLQTLHAHGRVIIENINPLRVWRGVIKPFETDIAAKEILRLLAADRPVDVLAGQVLPTSEASLMKHHPEESRMQKTGISFDVLVVELDPPAHPWVFSLQPAISSSLFPSHPHLRSDRSIALPSRTLNGLCVYSAAEFVYDPLVPRLPQFLGQVSIFLAKHVIWLSTQKLFNATGRVIHDGVDMTTIMRNLPSNSIWQVQPDEPTIWRGFWPGVAAHSGREHLTLDPKGECWCGKGSRYIDCCLEREKNLYST